jgi:hypothetical protein
MYVFMYKMVIDKNISKHLKCAKVCTTTDNNLDLMIIL